MFVIFSGFILAVVGLVAGWAKCVDVEPRNDSRFYGTPVVGPLLSRVRREGWIVLTLISIGTLATMYVNKIEQDRVNSTAEATVNYAKINAFVQRVDFLLNRAEYQKRGIEKDLSLCRLYFANGRIEDAKKKLKLSLNKTLSRVKLHNDYFDGAQEFLSDPMLTDEEILDLTDPLREVLESLDKIDSDNCNTRLALIQLTLDEVQLKYRMGLSSLRSSIRFETENGEQLGPIPLGEQLMEFANEKGTVRLSTSSENGGYN